MLAEWPIRERSLLAGRAVCLILVASLSGCGTVKTLTRLEGNGGWNEGQRRRELDRRAAAASVNLSGFRARAGDTSTPEGPLDLPAVLDLARHRSYRVREAERRLDAARERVAGARGRLLPSTVASGRYSWYTDAQTTQVDLPPQAIEQLGGAPPTVRVREADVGAVNATVNLPLDFSGEILQLLRAAQAGYRGERARLWATTLEQQTRAVQAYFELLEAQRLRDVTEQTIALNHQQLADAEARFRAGRVTKNEVLVVQVALRDSEQRLVQRELAIDRARWTLNQTIGLPVDAPTRLVDVTVRPSLFPIQEVLRLAYSNNPLLLSLQEEQQRLEATAASLARSRLPRFSAGGAIDYSTSDLLQPQEIGSGFVGFNWDLGTDTRRESQIAEALIAARENRLRIEGELRELEEALLFTHRAVEERLAALDAAGAAVEQAEENLRIRREQFCVGRAASEDVLDAEALLAAQRATLASALYQAHMRRADLQQLIGFEMDAPARLTDSR
jgi:outer membrane protein